MKPSSDFGTIVVRMIETAGLLLLVLLLVLLLLTEEKQCLRLLLKDFLSEEDEGSGDEDPERLLLPAALPQGEAGLVSGSARQAVGVSKSILCLTRR